MTDPDPVETWTAKAVAALRRGRDAHRDAVLECGRCCYEALRAAAAAGRYSYGLRADLARRLGEAAGQKADVSRYVLCDRVATLLGGGCDLGKLGLSTIRAFYPLVRRLPAAPSPGSLRRDRGRVAKGEEYEVVAAYREAGPALFARAAAEGWSLEAVRYEVAHLAGARSGRGRRPGKILTIGQVARVAGVAPKTAVDWFDEGRFDGFRINDNRRVYADSAAEYFASIGHHRAAAELLTPGGRTYLLVGLGAVAARLLADHLGDRPDAPGVASAATLLEAGQLVERHRPEAVALSLALGRGACLEAARHLATLRPLPRTVGVLTDDCSDDGGLVGAGFVAVVGTGAGPEGLAAALGKPDFCRRRSRPPTTPGSVRHPGTD